MATKTIRVLRKFLINGETQDIGKVITVTEVEAVGLVAIKKAEIIDVPIPKAEAKKEEPKKEEQKTEAPKTREASTENKKGGKGT